MEDQVYQATEDLRVWRVSVSAGSAIRSRDEIIDQAAGRRIVVVVLDGAKVFGSDQLRAALYHAKKALAEGRNASDSLAMETLLYASGERQLSSAIKKMSIDASTKEMVVAQLSPGELEQSHSWRQEQPVREGIQDSEFVRFGCSSEQLSALGSEKRMELVLEIVAAVDVLKK